MTSEIEKQQQGEKLVEKHIIHRASLLMDEELKRNPEVLEEAENYFPVDENGKRDDENGEYPEIMEFWIVSDWLADKLKDWGEVVFELYDFKIWGRQATGQAIKLDNTIQEIAEEYKF